MDSLGPSVIDTPPLAGRAESCIYPLRACVLLHASIIHKLEIFALARVENARIFTMVLGIVMMTAMLPTMYGLNESSKATRDQEDSRRSTSRKQRCHLVAMCAITQGTQSQREQVQNARVYVGRDGKVSIVTD